MFSVFGAAAWLLVAVLDHGGVATIAKAKRANIPVIKIPPTVI